MIALPEDQKVSILGGAVSAFHVKKTLLPRRTLVAFLR